MNNGKDSKTTRVPSSLIDKADKIAEDKDIPRTEAFKVLFSISDNNNFRKAVERAEKELYQNLILDYDEEIVSEAITALNLGPVLRKIICSNSEEDEEQRIELLGEKMTEIISELKEVE